jgi:curved DNA-binding protein
MEFKDYYAILGVKPTDDIKAIKTAYRRLARKYHPDVSSEADAEARFKEVAEAYEVLKDSERRAEYDQLLQHRNDPAFGRRAQREEAGHAEDFADIFSSMFGQGGARGRQQSHRQYATRGQDLEISVAMFLEETLSEQTRTLSYNVPLYNAFGLVEQEIPKTLNVKIPAGVADGERIRVKGQGVPGTGGGANGDLYLIIKLAPHPLFEVIGHDLEIVLPLAPWEAALGTKASVPTLSDSILLTIPAGSQTGQRLRVKGKGLVSKKQTGNLYAVIKVVMPSKPDDKSAALWQQLAEANQGFDPRTVWSKA